MLRHCLICLIAVGPLALLQLVAWFSMAVQADFSHAKSGSDFLSAVSAELSTPCQLCESVQATQAEQDNEAGINDRRVDVATAANAPRLQQRHCATTHQHVSSLPHWRTLLTSGPRPPPPRHA